MSLKSILAHAAPDERSNEVLDVACALAKAHEAHLIGLHISSDAGVSLRSPAGAGAERADGVDRIPDRGGAGPVPGPVRRRRRAPRRAGRMAGRERRSGQCRRHPRAIRGHRGDEPGRRARHAGRSGIAHRGGDPDRPAGADRAEGRGRSTRWANGCWCAGTPAAKRRARFPTRCRSLQKAEQVTVLAVNPERRTGARRRSGRRHFALSGPARRARRGEPDLRRGYRCRRRDPVARLRPRLRPDRHGRLRPFPHAGVDLRRRHAVDHAHDEPARS